MEANVKPETRVRTQALLDRMPAKARAELRAILHQAAHLLVCTPNELVDPVKQKHKWRRDLAPVLGGPGCVCKPMRWNDCVV